MKRITYEKIIMHVEQIVSLRDSNLIKLNYRNIHSLSKLTNYIIIITILDRYRWAIFTFDRIKDLFYLLFTLPK